MEWPDLSKVSAEQRTVTLIGRNVSLSDISFDPEKNRFYYGVMDATQFITYAQRAAYPSFDIERTNAETSDAKRGTGPTGSTSTLENFFSGVGDDLAAASQGIRTFVAGEPGQTSDLRKVIYAVTIGALLWLGWKLVTAIKSK